MKKLLFLFSFILFYSFYSPVKILAQVPTCAPDTRTQCTFCIDNGAGGCRPDYNLSCTPGHTYFPDPSLCDRLHSGCEEGTAQGNCLEAPACGNNGQPCTGNGQGSCCGSNPPLLCTGGICTQQTTCIPVGELCPGPAGTQGGCCSTNGLICDYWQVGDLTMKCQIPKIVTGYFCETSQAQCLPCYSGDTYFGCYPAPEYSTFLACDSPCRGLTPKKFACVNMQCVESGTGIYSNIADCTAACEVGHADGVRLFCGDTPDSGIRTAIGCIRADNPKALINQIVTWTISLASGLGLMSLLYAGFVMTTAGGNTQRVHEARESITSTLFGLAIIVLVTVILNFFGIKILEMGIMGFSV